MSYCKETSKSKALTTFQVIEPKGNGRAKEINARHNKQGMFTMENSYSTSTGIRTKLSHHSIETTIAYIDTLSTHL